MTPISARLYLQWSESVVFQEGEPDDRHQQELHSKRVICRVKCVPEADVDQVDGGIGQSQEHHLKHRKGRSRLCATTLTFQSRDKHSWL